MICDVDPSLECETGLISITNLASLHCLIPVALASIRAGGARINSRRRRTTYTPVNSVLTTNRWWRHALVLFYAKHQRRFACRISNSRRRHDARRENEAER